MTKRLLTPLCMALILTAPTGSQETETTTDAASETEAAPQASADGAAKPVVRFVTNLGEIVVQLDAEKAPKTVANILQYVDDGFYVGTIFHRVIDGFMLQGGGFTADLKKKDTREPVDNEADNGLSNVRGSLAMARTNNPHSASAQFFINTVDNLRLDRANSYDGYGYTVFGHVTGGISVVDEISKVETTRVGPHGNVPKEPIIIESAERAGPEESNEELLEAAGKVATDG